MPDTRRITGPENTKSPFLFCQDDLSKISEVLKNGKRSDGRKEMEHRPLYLQTGLIVQAKGSSYAEFGKTKVVCAVYGPREVARREDFSMEGQISCEVKFAPFSCRVRRPHVPDLEEKDLSNQVLEALQPAVKLDTFPKAQVDVYITVLENDGGVLSAAISAASLALADAGIEMYDLVVGCSVKVHENLILIDPTNSEEGLITNEEGSNVFGHLTIGFMPSMHQISAVSFHGNNNIQVLMQAKEKCQETCHRLYSVLQDTLIKAVEKRMNTSYCSSTLFSK